MLLLLLGSANGVHVFSQLYGAQLLCVSQSVCCRRVVAVCKCVYITILTMRCALRARRADGFDYTIQHDCGALALSTHIQQRVCVYYYMLILGVLLLLLLYMLYS